MKCPVSDKSCSESRPGVAASGGDVSWPAPADTPRARADNSGGRERCGRYAIDMAAWRITVRVRARSRDARRVAPSEIASSEHTRHPLSLSGERRLNPAVHLIAVTQVRMRHSVGRTYVEKMIAEDKTATTPRDVSNNDSIMIEWPPDLPGTVG
jgi:hypothetical protein